MEEVEINKINVVEEKPIMEISEEPVVVKPKRSFKKAKRVVIGVGGVLVVAVLLLGIFVGIPASNIYSAAKKVMVSGQVLKASVAEQNITKIKASLQQVKVDTQKLQGSFNALSWTKILPFAGNYWKDGEAGIKGSLYGIDAVEIGLKTAEPYADIIGFTGDNSKKANSGEENANDRIEFLIKTIKDIIPQIDPLAEKAKLAKTEFDKIDPNRYPEDFRGFKLRENIKKGLELIDEGTGFVSQSKPLLEAAPYLLGIDEPRTYLLLFQNDKERRPTGGFLTAYSIVQVNKGKLKPVSSNDIYNLDKKYTPSIPAPDPIVRYIKGVYALSPKLRLRDINWSPDFKESMELFLKEGKKAGLPAIDGIIAVDTEVVVKILEVIGQVGVPGFGNFNANTDPKCNCPQVVYALESYADVEGPVVWDQNDPTKIIFAPANYYNRKEVVGPLMNSVMANALGQTKDKLPKLFQAGWEAVTEKHILLYMLDAKAQEGVEAFNIAGRVKEYKDDYLFVDDANLGGRKSNLYSQEEVDQKIEIARDGSITKNVTITYKNPQSQDGWLNSVLPTWIRIYVPKGSQLIEADGFEEKAEPMEELGKTVFSGGFKLRPQGVVTLKLKYKLPFKVDDEYKLYLQKQPGLDAPLYTVTVNRQNEELFLKTDRELKFKL